MSKKGLLIAIEGGEGAGKTTQVQLLLKSLKKAGHEVISVREPGGNKISERIRSLVLNPQFEQMAPTTETLLYMAARAQVYTDVVLPALEAGQIVIMDRTRDSSLVYQGMVREQGVKKVEILNDFATGDRVPDITILIDVPVKTGFLRIEEEKLDRIELEGKRFHDKVRRGYLDLAEKNQGKRWFIVDGTKSIDLVAEAIWKVVKAFI